LLVFASCSPDAAGPTSSNLRVSTAKSASDIAVASASPDSATQDTTLDVVINGSGFVFGATATWALQGVSDSSQVRTNSTRYVNSRQLVANITISATATIAKWDVIVTASSKGGIGTELFAIKAKGNVDTNSRANYVVGNSVDLGGGNIQPAGIIGDARLKDGSSANGGDSEYQGGFCGTAGRITTSSNRDDIIFDPDGDAVALCGAARSYRFNLDGVWTAGGPRAVIYKIWAMPVGSSMTTPLSFGFNPVIAGCTYLAFDSQYGTDNVMITRVDAGIGPRKWAIRSQGTHRAACVVPQRGGNWWTASGKTYYLPFAITVTEVPYPYPTYP
jgi:hypothetical protein